MVDKASAGSVAAAIRPPDFRKAVIAIRGIDAKKEKLASVQSEIGDIWARVEGLKIDKTAGKFFAKLDKLEPADRAVVIRSFNGLADASGWEKDYEDLADMADGSVVHMRVGGEQEKPAPDADGKSDEPAAKGRSGSLKDSLDKAKKHLGGKQAAGTGSPDAMTG